MSKIKEKYRKWMKRHGQKTIPKPSHFILFSNVDNIKTMRNKTNGIYRFESQKYSAFWMPCASAAYFLCVCGYVLSFREKICNFNFLWTLFMPLLFGTGREIKINQLKICFLSLLLLGFSRFVTDFQCQMGQNQCNHVMGVYCKWMHVPEINTWTSFGWWIFDNELQTHRIDLSLKTSTNNLTIWILIADVMKMLFWWIPWWIKRVFAENLCLHNCRAFQTDAFSIK